MNDHPELHERRTGHPRPYGARLLLAPLEAERADKLWVPPHAARHNIERGVVVENADPECEIPLGAVVYWTGNPVDLGHWKLIASAQVLAWEAD